MSKLLIDEAPLQVLPSLAKEIGLNEAIILQQVHYWITDKEKRRDKKSHIDGKYWVYNSYPEWRQQFPFWSDDTIYRAVKNLESRGLLVSMQTNSYDRRKWYTIDYTALDALMPSPQDAEMDSAKCGDGSPQDAEITSPQDAEMLTESRLPTEITQKNRGRKRRPPDPRSSDPAIQLFKQITKYYPNAINYDEVIAALSGKTQEQVEPFYKEWVGRGYNKQSIKWATEWAARGSIPPQGKNGKGAHDNTHGRTGKAEAVRMDKASQIARRLSGETG